MRRDPKVFVMGLQVARAGNSDGTTTDLWREFGEKRVMDMPIVQATTAATV